MKLARQRLSLALACAVIMGGCASPRGSAPERSEPPVLQSVPALRSPIDSAEQERLKPRPHHYLFAHRILPEFFFRDTDRLFLALRENPTETLVGIWDKLGESLAVEDRLPADGLSAECRDTDDGMRMCTVTLPEAQVLPEAIFAVLAIRGKERWYLTYERTLVPDALLEERAVLCAWTSDGTHLNYGFGGNYSRAGFEETLQRFFETNPEPRASTSVRSSADAEPAADAL